MNKIHYYDGFLYKIIVDPVFNEIRKIIFDLVDENSKVIDIGCGTGKLVLELSKKCKTVYGVDLSSRMIDYAKKDQLKKKIENVYFEHKNATAFNEIKEKEFDFAIFSMIIHEVSPRMREELIKEAKRIAKKVIVADYRYPQPFSVWGLIVFMAEFLAGPDHFKNFRNFQKNKGINELIKKCFFNIKFTVYDKKGILKVIII